MDNYALANFLIALGTSLPELSIGIQAAIANQSSLSLGNVLGSNIANLSIVIGGATLIGGSLKVNKNVIQKNILITFLIAIAPLLFMIDRELGTIDGLILLTIFIFWEVSSFPGQNRRKRLLSSLKTKVGRKKVNHLAVHATKLFFGLGGLLISAHILVDSAHFLASHFNIPPIIVGIFLVGLGSSLPELVLQSKAIKNHQSEIALGDLFGSVVFNSSLIVGLTAILQPFNLTQPRLYFLSAIFFLIAFGLFYLFIRTKNTLERWEGAILLMLYLILVAIGLV
jgi:cation:H+ antiporter